MKLLLITVLGFCCAIASQAHESTERIFDNLIEDELSLEEIELFRPIWEPLQKEYEDALSENHDQTEQGQLMLSLLENELEKQLMEEDALDVAEYTINLPTVEEILKGQNASDPIYEDMKAEMELAIVNAKTSITDLILKANEAETNLSNRKGGRITLVKIIYKLLRKVFRVVTTVIRAAYCTYSHVPQVISAVKSVDHRTKDCGRFAINATIALRHTVQESIDEISNSVHRMGQIYLNAMGRKTLVGKIFYFVISVGRIQDQISNAGTQAATAIKAIVVGTPQIIISTKNCQINAIKDTVQDVKSVLLTIKQCIPEPN